LIFVVDVVVVIPVLPPYNKIPPTAVAVLVPAPALPASAPASSRVLIAILPLAAVA
jgi:hypothetical protein